MSRAVYFYVLEQDITDLLVHLRSKVEFSLIHRHCHERRVDSVPDLASLPLREGRCFEGYMVRTDEIANVVLLRGHTGVWYVDMASSPVLEVSLRAGFDEEGGLVTSRFYCTTDYGFCSLNRNVRVNGVAIPDGYTPKPASLMKWYDQIFKVTKKFLGPFSKHLDGYVGLQAREWFARGGRVGNN